ncbi:MAG: hypothetical protein Q9167_003769 [Letrouitia subvulpina]
MGAKHHLKPLERQQIITERDYGMKLRELAEKHGRAMSTIRDTIKKAETRAATDQKDLPRAGAPKKFKPDSQRRWYQRMQRDPAINYRDITAMEGCERSTVRRGLKAYAGEQHYFGPELNSGVIRNAGGRATPDAVKSIVALRSLVDAKGVFVVHHTDCGLTYLTDAGIREEAKARTPAAAAEVDALPEFGCFTKEEFEDAIREDVRKLRDQKVLEGMEIKGMAFDLEDGIVRVVD